MSADGIVLGGEALRGRPDARSAAGRSPGLVPTINNPHALGITSSGVYGAKLAFQIDLAAARLKRMRGRVEHSVRLAAAHLSRVGAGRWRPLFQTLTYREVDGWSAEHLTEYFHRVRQWAARRDFKVRYAWVAETQKRGAIHYHVVLWVPSRYFLPKPDLCGWWPHGSTETDRVKGGTSGVIGYLCKYLSKGLSVDSPALPKGARCFGAAGHPPEERRELRYRLAPFWVRDALGTWADIRKSKGGWLDRQSGEFLRSLWRVHFGGPGCIWAYQLAA